MSHFDKDDVFAVITGIIGQVIGIITTESFVLPLVMALAGGFLGYVGKHMGIKLMTKYFPNRIKKKQDHE